MEKHNLNETDIERNTENENKAITKNKYAPQIQSLDTTQLEVNKQYSYKQLCTLLNQPIKEGNSKKRQLLEFSRFFDYEKISSKYHILDIYRPPADYIPIIQDNSKYTADMINTLLAYLYSTGQQVLYVSHADLILICGLANEVYKQNIKEYRSLAKEYNIDLKQINDFYTYTYQFFKSIISNALISMEGRCIIKCINTFVIVERTTNDKVNKQFVLKEATNQEMLDILDMQYEALEKVGLKNIKELWYKPQFKEAYYTVFKELYSKKYPYWEFCYPSMKILAPATIIRKQIDTDDHRKELNLKVFNVLHDKSIKQYRDMYTGSPSAADEWFNNQQTLEDKLIKLMSITN